VESELMTFSILRYRSGLMQAVAGMNRKVWGNSSQTCMVCALVALLGGNLRSEEIAFDDFENVMLVPFDVANTPTFSDGTDWTNVIPGWNIENAANHVPTTSAAYNGWVAMDVNSWALQQGNQGSGIAPTGRSRMKLGGNANNTALVADPDGWDDFPPAGKPNGGFNSYIRHTYDLTGADLNSLAVSFDWDYVTEGRQIAVVELSFDGGANYSILEAVASSFWINDATWGPYAFGDQLSWSTNPGTDSVQSTQRTFFAGTDFTVPPGSTSMIVRFGCIEAGNNWWFSVDNVELADANGILEFEDFESLTLLDFPAGGVGTPPGDGTDYSQNIPNWTVDNDGFWDPELKMYTVSTEGAFQGWTVLDSNSWRNQQGGQLREEFFPNPLIFPQRNTILVADSDAHDDFDVELPNDHPDKNKKEFNSFISREYDVSGYNNTTIRVEMDWESRIESAQRGLVQVSFDCGDSWVTLLDVDSDDQAKLTALRSAGYLYYDGTGGGVGVNNNGDIFSTFNAPQSWQFTNAAGALPAKNGSKMILRLGCIDSQNNWWFAVDNILIEGTPQSFKHGDANQDGVINFDDVAAFSLALSDKAAYNSTYAISADVILDMNADGVFNFGDIAGFECELSAIGPVSQVVGSFISHGGYTGGGSSIDAGKSLAQEGSGPTLLGYSNVINTARGINGLAFDLEGAVNPGSLSASDFVFQMSPQGAFDEGTNPPSGWTSAPAPLSVTVTSGSSDRVQIAWADNAIENRWLRVTVSANANTGLVIPRTYYLGHVRGETDAVGTTFTVAFADITPIRAGVGATVDSSSILDIDKNGTVSFADISAMRSNVGTQLTIITIP